MGWGLAAEQAATVQIRNRWSRSGNSPRELRYETKFEAGREKYWRQCPSHSKSVSEYLQKLTKFFLLPLSV